MLICPPVGGARRVTFALIGSLTFGACTTVSRPSGAQPVSAQAQQLIDEAWQASKNWQCDLMASKIRELRNYMPLNDTIKSLIIADSRCMAITNARANQPQSPPANASTGVANASDSDHDYAQAMIWYRKAADQGHALAQAGICILYGQGHGVRQDYGEAAIWCRKAADQGLAAAQNYMGLAYRDGLGVRQDFSEAMRWYRKAADQGLADAQRDLGYLYMVGHGAKQDFSEAVRWSRKAADQGDALAQNNIGVLYEHGLGVRQDNAEAMGWYRKAADQGTVLAQNNVKKLQQKEATPALSADVHGSTYTCLDRNGYRSVLTIDPVRRLVRVTNYVGKVPCRETLVDGAVGPISSKASCNLPMIGDQAAKMIVRQSVSIGIDRVTWDGVVVGPPTLAHSNQFHDLYEELDLKTGQIKDASGNVGSCRP
jgi:hypothetical protein